MLEWPGSPAGVMLTSWLLAALPILLLVVLILGFGWSAARAGPAGWLAAAFIARLSYGAGPEVLAVAQAKALFLAVDVLLIVWAAFLLYRVVDEAGGVATLAAALPRLTPDRGMQALLIGWAFASFLQGVGGFGVPVVVTAPILLGLGFDPVTAVVAPSLGHAWSVTFGSLGSSFQALIAASGVPGPVMSAQSAALLGAACLVCGAMVLHVARGRIRLLLPVVLMGLAMAATQYALAVGGVWHIAGFGGGLAGLAVGFVLARSTRRPSGPSASEVVPVRLIVLALTGYALLVVITLAVQFIVPLRAVLGSVVIQAQFPAVATGLGVLTPAEPGKSLVLLRHAGAILVYTAALTYFILLRAGVMPPRAAARIAVDTARGVLGSSVAIVSMTGMVTIMAHAGMTDVLARGLAQASGAAFPLVAPWIGALGAFVSGSNTSSNLLFGMLQRRTAEVLAIHVAWILAAQTAGGAIGSVLSPTKVSVGATSTREASRPTGTLRGTEAEEPAADQEGRIIRHVLRYAAPLLLGLGVLTALALAGGQG
ncbi:MAG: Lactate permease family protein [Anaerolineales bacterium]|nr:Lactate permease family protein [Anaerolineales bacterium]